MQVNTAQRRTARERRQAEQRAASRHAHERAQAEARFKVGHCQLNPFKHAVQKFVVMR